MVLDLVGAAVGGYKYGLKGIISGFFGGVLLVGSPLVFAAIVTRVLPSIAIAAGFFSAGVLGEYMLYDPPCYISLQMAMIYTYRSLLGMTIIGQIETRDGGYCKVVMDDGSMMTLPIRQLGYDWLARHAYIDEGIRPSNGKVCVRIDEYTETWLKPVMDSFWVKQMSGVKVYGSYDVEFSIDELGRTLYTVSNFNIHWLGWDRIDANPDKEWSDNKILWFVESMVGVVGDGMLGADFPIMVYSFEYAPDKSFSGRIPQDIVNQ
ncbi:MAG: hypothetical protein LBE12_02685 [Planctomycetaceae bacterium]|nr:hypothetical protein [Planctomycetaceae bacterium]